MKKNILDIVYNFFIDSNDFNGIPLRKISKNLNIDYISSIETIKELVNEDKVSIQSSTNPNIIGFQHYPQNIQIQILEDAKLIEISYSKFGDFTIESENTEFPICLYPSKEYLVKNRDLKDFERAEYSKRLALAEPHLEPVFFEMDVLDRYITDPRYDFKFEDYSGSIIHTHDEQDTPHLREEDQIFLNTFGLAFGTNNDRIIAVYLRYLKDLTPDHQTYWKTKEIGGACKVLKEYHDNIVLGNWNTSYSIFNGFIGELNCLYDLSQFIFSKPLLLKKFNEEKRLREFTYFLSPTSKNYSDFVLLLDKMMSENLNKDFFKNKVELFDLEELGNGIVERKPKGTIRLFEEWISSQFKSSNDNDLKNLFKIFKDIRKERQSPAHKIIENKYDKNYTQKRIDLVKKGYNSMRILRHIFQQHPHAKTFNTPKWLENSDIKNF
ncbi:hypothetical protein DVK85_11575 [Flavobacterium arcticum]|uniref:Uncharacterized protein n=1 Tax=Flavobacterium arcticum TaxID=1784713 RepID=A0A345HE23_9FLAO|nr:hypothetical protein [Flavobacterium arcticum]AXG74833.1 hypothetical protein DVK85_11575 [Flavobacterium arcticum]KAF2509667.1 hypothetical protein E0W72_09095 [Flavobacterium arcticum]